MGRWSRCIVEPTRRLRLGDWCDQGLANYAGAVRYKDTVNWDARDGERLFVEPDGHRATAVAVHVNGQLAGVMGWAPYSLEITSALKPGANELVIELVGSGRNLLGPHYHRFRALDAVGPDHFNPEAANETEPQLVHYGLNAPIQLVRRK